MTSGCGSGGLSLTSARGPCGRILPRAAHSRRCSSSETPPRTTMTSWRASNWRSSSRSRPASSPPRSTSTSTPKGASGSGIARTAVLAYLRVAIAHALLPLGRQPLHLGTCGTSDCTSRGFGLTARWVAVKGRSSMRALVTNDDGIASEGIRTLAACARRAGLEVTVAAPSWDTSGASASLTAVEKDGRVLVSRQPAEGWGDVEAFGVEAAPAYIVRAGVHGAFGPPPDIVLSGVNSGPNTGHAVLHSGTVGAAMTASTFERPAAAFSLDVDGSAPANWATAASVIQSVLSWLIDNPRQILLNVNIPD